MALPTAQQTFSRVLDPSGRLPYYPVLKQDETSEAMLQPGESVVSFTVALTPVAVAAGLSILNTGGREPKYENLMFRFWAEVLPESRGSALFDRDGGIALGVEITFETDRGLIDQFTVGVRVANK